MVLSKGDKIRFKGDDSWYTVARVGGASVFYFCLHGKDGVFFDTSMIDEVK